MSCRPLCKPCKLYNSARLSLRPRHAKLFMQSASDAEHAIAGPVDDLLLPGGNCCDSESAAVDNAGSISWLHDHIPGYLCNSCSLQASPQQPQASVVPVCTNIGRQKILRDG